MSGSLQRATPMLLVLLLHGALLIALLRSLQPMLDRTDLHEVVISLIPLQITSASRQTKTPTHTNLAPQSQPSEQPVQQTVPRPSPEPVPATVVQSSVAPVTAPTALAPTATPAHAPAYSTPPVATTSAAPATEFAHERTAKSSLTPLPAPAERTPVAVSGVDYLMPPKLTYPLGAKRAGEQGKVLLRMLIDERGHPERVDIHLSSGYARLDEAARSAAQHALFKPHLEDGRPASVYVVVPINFSLN